MRGASEVTSGSGPLTCPAKTTGRVPHCGSRIPRGLLPLGHSVGTPPACRGRRVGPQDERRGTLGTAVAEMTVFPASPSQTTLRHPPAQLGAPGPPLPSLYPAPSTGPSAAVARTLHRPPLSVEHTPNQSENKEVNHAGPRQPQSHARESFSRTRRGEARG